ncbi:MAG: hypothetical protein ACRDBO_07585 [Lachnospiraceae bacterium]
MGKSLLHISIILKSNNPAKRVKISDYKTPGNIKLLDSDKQLIPINISTQIYMNHLSCGRIGFLGDFLIAFPDNICLEPEINQDKPWKIKNSDIQHELSDPTIPFFENGSVIKFNNGYQLWVTHPFSWVYQVTTDLNTNNPILCYDKKDSKYLNLKEQDWTFDVISISLIDTALNQLYIQTF